MGLDVSIPLAIHRLSSPALNTIMTNLTIFGDPRLLATASLVIFTTLWRRRQPFLAAHIVLFLAGTGLLTAVAKDVFMRSRPELWIHTVHESSFSFPSGHASTSMAIGLLVLWSVHRHTTRRITRLLASVGVTLYVSFIAFSRLYLGVHYPSDIIGGWLLTLTWFGVLLLIFGRYYRQTE